MSSKHFFLLFFFLLMSFTVKVCAQLQFVENKGQWERQVLYKTDINSGALFLEKGGFTVVLHNAEDMNRLAERHHGYSSENKDAFSLKNKSVSPTVNIPDTLTLRSHAYKVRFSGANENCNVVTEKAATWVNNYFLGNDPKKWAGGCHSYQSVTYKDIYPGIDLHYYTDAGKLKYDFIIRPGGNVNDIRMEYIGADGLRLDNKELVLSTSVGDVRELYPYTYQYGENSKEVIDCRYVLKNNIVRFAVKGASPGATVVIDPTLVFSTLTGSSVDNWGYTATPGPDGSFFLGGIVFGSGYPVSTGAYQTSFNGGVVVDRVDGFDVGIMKISSDGKSILYATYLGGAANEQPHSMICDASGKLTVAGRTTSSNFPLKNLGKVGNGGGYDIFITTFNTSGSGIIGSVVIGGSGDDGVNIKDKDDPSVRGAYSTRQNYGDDARSEVILDASENIVLASCTQSTNFPLSANAVQKSNGGGQDGVIIKLSPDLSSLIFSSYLGGNGDDACFVVSINPLTGNIYFAGGTSSTNFPGDHTNVISSGYQGGKTDGFVAEIDPNGNSLIKSTYLGTVGIDIVYGIQFDKYGYPYVMGTTTGSWTVLNANYKDAGGKQFIAKLRPDLSAYEYSTVFGTNAASPNLSPTAFLVDRCQNVYVSGWGGGLNKMGGYPTAGTTGLPVTSDAIKATTDGDDFYFFILEKNANSQLFGSFFGENYGKYGDHVDGGTSRFDANGIIYQAICANCGGGVTFPTTPGVISRTNNAIRCSSGDCEGCNEAAVKIEMNFSGVVASIKPTINGNYDTVGCVPMMIAFTDTLAKGKKYIWNFGDGTSNLETTSATASHTYNKVGTFRVRLISVDSSTCNISDTAYVNIKVGNNIVTPSFDAQKTGPCNSYIFQFTNTTTATKPFYADTTFVWDFGDGSALERSGYVTKQHSYPGPGNYTVKLTVKDTTFCNSPETVEKVIRIATNVKAAFTNPAKICLGSEVAFSNNSVGGVDFSWDFGDGATSTDVTPKHVYNSTGQFTVRLIATDMYTCNLHDTFTATINVLPMPVADFSFTPYPVQENTPEKFINNSLNADSYSWDFGDANSTSTLKDPEHQFSQTGTYSVCLVAISNAGCTDTLCKNVPAIVVPLLDVPNAFTPGKNDENSVIKVRGFGFAKMSWKIYNRWGQKVFESDNKDYGWDGTYKGKLQPMDVYTYVLDVEFLDRKKVRRTGDITLIR